MFTLALFCSSLLKRKILFPFTSPLKSLCHTVAPVFATTMRLLVPQCFTPLLTCFSHFFSNVLAQSSDSCLYEYSLHFSFVHLVYNVLTICCFVGWISSYNHKVDPALCEDAAASCIHSWSRSAQNISAPCGSSFCHSYTTPMQPASQLISPAIHDERHKNSLCGIGRAVKRPEWGNSYFSTGFKT